MKTIGSIIFGVTLLFSLTTSVFAGPGETSAVPSEPPIIQYGPGETS